MPLQATSGAASYDGFGGGVAAVPQYIENVFSTYLYTGNSATNAISNGIDLSTKGGLVWIKNRSFTTDHFLADTVRGIGGVSGSTYYLQSNTTNAQSSSTNLMSADATGFTLLPNATSTTNGSYNYASWTFRKQPKFFDVVTYTGTGSARTIAHNLASVPGCIIVKRTDTSGDWRVYHRGLTSASYMIPLNLTSAQAFSNAFWNGTAPTSSVFSLGTNADVNASGGTYVAYLFAHDAGGFGLTGTDNVISCGSFAGGTNVTVNLGYEPQWLLVKQTNSATNWFLMDTMRGFTASQGDVALSPNVANAEPTASSNFNITSTGFVNVGLGTGTDTYIYIAIRRGPMKVPTSGTSVFSPNISSGTTGTVITTNFPVDMQIGAFRSIAQPKLVVDRLRGVNTSPVDTGIPYLNTTSTAADTSGAYSRNWGNTGFEMPLSRDSTSNIFWNFQRAPSFFDEVCYTGTGVTHTETHNLGVAPELIIVKRRASATASWAVYAAPLTASYVGFLDLTNAFQADNMWNSTAPTSTAFTVRAANAQVNASGSTYVAYLFATCAGVSKVGSYTGTGTTLQVDCGFTGGARFVLIKRTDSTGDWYVWDTARGIVSGNDPYLLLNSTAAETTTTDYIDPYSAGFEISSTAPAAINASGGTYIYLAIA